MEDESTIGPVVRRKLCTGCGTCAGVCPQGAIEMVVHRRKGCYLPRLDRKRCTRCGLCHQACPGHGVDFESLNDKLFGDIPEDVAVGRYLGCYVGHASDGSARRDCASGGLVSALLIFALEEGLIDAALVVRMRQDDPLRPEPFLARTKAEILSAAGSKYCPVPVGTTLNEILRTEGRFAVVGLPCHIQGIRKAEEHMGGLTERIRYRISLPCRSNYSFRGTKRILQHLRIPRNRVCALRYHGQGGPVGMSVRLEDGTERTVSLADHERKFHSCSLGRCTLCSDMLGELSDLTCGAALVPGTTRTDKACGSFVVSRTPEAEELLEAAASSEAVALSELGIQDLLASQGDILSRKRRLQARIRMLKWMGKNVPLYRQKLPAPIQDDCVDAPGFHAARSTRSGPWRGIAGLFGWHRHAQPGDGPGATPKSHRQGLGP